MIIFRVINLNILLCVALLWSNTPLANDFAHKNTDTRSTQFTIGLSVWSGYPESVRGFKAGLAEGGLVEGQHIKFLMGNSGGNKEKQAEIARGFREASVDLVYSLTTPGTTIMKQVLPESTPIVFSIVTYPADSGLIESFDYSSNNLVGTSNFVPYKHYLELLNQLLPNLKSIAIFHRLGEPNSKIQAANMRRMLRKQGVEVVINNPATLQEVEHMAKSLIGKVEAFMTTTDTLMQNGGEKILIGLSLTHEMPILSSNKEGIRDGSSFGPVADFYTLGKLSGEMAVKILKGNKTPSQLVSKLQNPPQRLMNRDSLKKLNLVVPQHMKVVYVR